MREMAPCVGPEWKINTGRVVYGCFPTPSFFESEKTVTRHKIIETQTHRRAAAVGWTVSVSCVVLASQLVSRVM